MICYSAERAAAKTTSVGRYAELHLFYGRDAAVLLIAWMIIPHIVQTVQLVQFIPFQRRLRRILHYEIASVILLYEPGSCHSVVASVLHRKTAAIFLFGRDDIPEIRQDHIVLLDARVFHPYTSPIYPRNIPDIYPGIQRFSDLHHGPFTHPINQYIGPGVHHYGTPYLIVPVIIMAQPPEAGLQTTYYHRHIPVCLPGPVAVNDDCPVGPPARLAAR